MDDLEKSVIKYVKEWVKDVQPKPQHVDGPWKAYVKRVCKNLKPSAAKEK